MQFANLVKAALLGSALVIAGCGGGSNVQDTSGGADTDAGADSGATTYSVEEQARLEAEEQARQEEMNRQMEQERLLGITTFYFDVDQSVVKPEARPALEAHARNLAQNGGTVVLEGHSDERGTREYNLALGERRAEAIARYLSVLGVSSQQIEAVSYGEERPASLGHDESSWSLNRRVELRYGN